MSYYGTETGGVGNDDFNDGTNGAGGLFDGFYGGDGNDLLLGNSLGNTHEGGRGNDWLIGGSISNFSYTGGGTSGNPYGVNEGAAGSGADYMEGGQGRDALYGLDGNDTLYGGDGDDSGSFQAWTGSYIHGGLYGGSGSDWMDGGNGNDIVFGGTGNDTLTGGFGVNSLYGEGGADLIYAFGNGDYADGGTEGDFMYTSLTNGATLHGNSGNDAIACGNVGSSLYGESGADTCFGGFGADFINGGSESDAVGGYYGNDTLYGGTGGDYFNMLYDTRVGELDTIGDWNTGGAQDFLLFSAQYASNTGWFQSGANVYAYQTLGTGTYYVYIANANVANVQANTFFL